jgi:putative OPT family oligopeptide transporter
VKDPQGRPIRHGPYPELTWTAVFVGYIIGAVVTLSFGYASLVLGFGKNASELAAILGFGILRGILRRTSIVENNINQTIASAVNSSSGGMMFSIPALFIMNHTNFNPYLTVIACISGGILGIAFVIPLRKQMIDYSRLTYPGGVAVATILKTPGAGVKKSLLMIGGFLIGATFYLVVKILGFKYWDFGATVGLPPFLNLTFFISVMTIAVGYLAGRGGVFFFIGGYVCYFVLSPTLSSMGVLPSPEVLTELNKNMPDYLRLFLFRPVGIGMLIGGALTGIILAFPLIKGAITSMQRASKMKKSISKDELSIKFLYAAIAIACVVLFIVASLSTKEMGFGRGLIMAILGVLWIWIAGVIVSECLGRTNWSPLSGMTLIAVTILILVSSGLSDAASTISSVIVGAAVCVALAQAGDMMQDLKTGFLVGSTPAKQQIGQFLSTWMGPILIMGLIFVLHNEYVLGSKELPAPQGKALASVIQGIQGGDVPVLKYIAGALIGALLSTGGIGGLGVLTGLGFYMPFAIVLTYSLGCFIRIFVDWKKGTQFSHNVGIPIAAGLIVGEALVGIGYALIKVINGAIS